MSRKNLEREGNCVERGFLASPLRVSVSQFVADVVVVESVEKMT